MKEIFLKDLSERVSAPLASGYPEADKWQRMPYEAGGISGVGLAAGECSDPEPIAIRLGVKGWHRVYLCIGRMYNGESHMQISFSRREGVRRIMPSHIDIKDGYWMWQGYEFAEEVCLGEYDLTGETLYLAKEKVTSFRTNAFLLWIRLEEMTEKETAEYLDSGKNRTVQYHFDNDFAGYCNFRRPEDYLGWVNSLEHANGHSLVYEISFDDCDPARYAGRGTYRRVSAVGNAENLGRYAAMRDRVKELVGKRAHEFGMEIYGGMRMELGDFLTPYDPMGVDTGIADALPACRIRDRLGRDYPALSYAYPEARKAMIDRLISCLPADWDGVSLLFHRGIFLGFEEPVLEYVKKESGADARRLPIADERLNGAWCRFLTLFLSELRAALSDKSVAEGRPRYKINVFVFYDEAGSKRFGLDAVKWAELGLVDSVSQGLMTYYENLDGLLDADGLIDLGKYAEAEKENAVLRRLYDDALAVLAPGIEDYKDLEKHGVTFFAALPWENKPWERYIATAEQAYRLGAKKLAAWNTTQQVTRPAVLEGVKLAGERDRILAGEKLAARRRLLRVTKLNDNPIGWFDPNWRG